MKILLFIITYKASHRVAEVVKEIPIYYFKNFNYKILISDDMSQDSTIRHIKRIQQNYKRVILNFNKTNLGYGANIKKCLNYAYKNKYDYAAMIHGDNQYSPRYLKKMFSLMKKKKNAAVTGSRMLHSINALKGGMPMYKFVGNIFLTKIFNLFNKTNFSDCHTGYWVYDLKKIKKDWLKEFDNGFLFDLDMRKKIVSNNLKIGEIPIHTRYGGERSSIHLIYAIRFFFKSIFNMF